jgi:hypothetical protein
MASAAAATPLPPRRALPPRFAQQDRHEGWISLLPLLLSIPLMYWPRVLEGDTQPWVGIGALIAFLTYWPRRATYSQAFPVVATVLGILAIGAFWIRDPDRDMLNRYVAIIGTLMLLWHVGNRGVHHAVGTFIRITIVLWFLVGLYQTVALRLGLPVEFFGRYAEGRSGVPSLTAEPSFYGSISVLHIMYMIADRRRRDWIFYLVAVLNVVLSGSILSFLLLVFPASRLPWRYQLMLGAAALVVLVFGIDLLSSGFFGRLQSFGSGSLVDRLLSDYSSNLRAGHVVFTFWDALPRELLFTNDVDFFYEYNHWAYASVVFVPNDSGFILPIGGELLFRSGAVGLLIILMFLRTAYGTCLTRRQRIEKVAFVFACMLNPVSMTNPAFILYIHKRYQSR